VAHGDRYLSEATERPAVSAADAPDLAAPRTMPSG
jgi:hypothetical protein